MLWPWLGHMQTICCSLQTDNHTNTSSLNFYRPDALPDAIVKALKAELRQQCDIYGLNILLLICYYTIVAFSAFTMASGRASGL